MFIYLPDAITYKSLFISDTIVSHIFIMSSQFPFIKQFTLNISKFYITNGHRRYICREETGMLAASEIDLDILKVAQGMIDFRLDTVCSNMNPVFGKLQIDVYPSVCYNLYRICNLRILDHPVFVSQYNIKSGIKQVGDKIKAGRIICYDPYNITISIQFISQLYIESHRETVLGKRQRSRRSKIQIDPLILIGRMSQKRKTIIIDTIIYNITLAYPYMQ